jgi:hypothetical protein
LVINHGGERLEVALDQLLPTKKMNQLASKVLGVFHHWRDKGAKR